MGKSAGDLFCEGVCQAAVAGGLIGGGFAAVASLPALGGILFALGGVAAISAAVVCGAACCRGESYKPTSFAAVNRQNVDLESGRSSYSSQTVGASVGTGTNVSKYSTKSSSESQSLIRS